MFVRICIYVYVHVHVNVCNIFTYMRTASTKLSAATVRTDMLNISTYIFVYHVHPELIPLLYMNTLHYYILHL